MNKLSYKSNQKGFTIIEVLIVLAIAGLIIAIVLFAVPALQRNGRNTAIKSDANQIVGYVSDYVSNNDGSIPVGVAILGGTVTVTGTGQTVTGKIQSGTVQNPTLAGAQAAVTPVSGTVTIVTAAKCGVATGANHSTLASPRTVAVVYSIETSSTNLAKCVSN